MSAPAIPDDVRRSTIAKFRADHRGIGRKVEPGSLDLIALLHNGSIRSTARDGSTANQVDNMHGQRWVRP